jgi:hypothetical protein
MKSKFMLLMILLGISLAACNPAGNPSLTPTRKPTNTELAPSSTWTQTPDPTNTPTPVDLQIEVYGVDWLGSGDLLITLQGVEPFTGDYSLELLGYSYNCRIAQDSELLLFCAGRVAPQGTSVTVYLLQEAEEREAFRTDIYIPYQSSSNSGGGADGPMGTPNLTPKPVTTPVPTT